MNIIVYEPRKLEITYDTIIYLNNLELITAVYDQYDSMTPQEKEYYRRFKSDQDEIDFKKRLRAYYFKISETVKRNLMEIEERTDSLHQKFGGDQITLKNGEYFLKALFSDQLREGRIYDLTIKINKLSVSREYVIDSYKYSSENKTEIFFI